LRAEREVLDIDETNKQTLERFMDHFAQRLFAVMQNEAMQPWGLVQQTEFTRLAEWHQSGIFKRHSLQSGATVSTQVLIIHKSGNTLVSETMYEHGTNWFRRFAALWPCCKCIAPPEYRVKQKTSLFFELGKSDKSLLRIENEDDTMEEEMLLTKKNQ